jgi:XRE family aerobic/anaerobic benzoate catabolism transcriptional regulator
VRTLRDELGLPRRELAERSGVSLRFLAQLEDGTGNISVARLADVADALGTTPAALLASQSPTANGPEAPAARVRASIESLLAGRADGDLREVRAWLESRFAPARGPVIALLGLRGAGKSTVGRQLATRLGLPFFELDALIEEAAGLSLGSIFELHGEAYYRRLERERLAAFLAETDAAVLATGGSLVTDRETYRLLRRRAMTVWLRARPEEHMKRVVAQGDERPMARSPHAMAELKALLAARERLYAEADHTIETSGRIVDDVVDRIATLADAATHK